MPIRMRTGSNTPRPAAKRSNRNRKLAKRSGLESIHPDLRQALQENTKGGILTNSTVIVAVIVVLLILGGVYYWFSGTK